MGNSCIYTQTVVIPYERVIKSNANIASYANDIELTLKLWGHMNFLKENDAASMIITLRECTSAHQLVLLFQLFLCIIFFIDQDDKMKVIDNLLNEYIYFK